MATAEKRDSADHAREAVRLWEMGRKQQAADQYLNAIQLDSRWADDPFEITDELHWSMARMNTARDILLYLYAESLKSGKYKRITSNPDKMGGAPIIRDLRMPVITIVRMMAGGATAEDVLRIYPALELEDIQEALAYAKHYPLLNPVEG